MGVKWYDIFLQDPLESSKAIRNFFRNTWNAERVHGNVFEPFGGANHGHNPYNGQVNGLNNLGKQLSALSFNGSSRPFHHTSSLPLHWNSTQVSSSLSSWNLLILLTTQRSQTVIYSVRDVIIVGWIFMTTLLSYRAFSVTNYTAIYLFICISLLQWRGKFRWKCSHSFSDIMRS